MLCNMSLAGEVNCNECSRQKVNPFPCHLCMQPLQRLTYASAVYRSMTKDMVFASLIVTIQEHFQQIFARDADKDATYGA